MLAARHMRPSQKLWRLSALAGVVVALGAAVAWLLESRPVLTDDFIAYWSAARLLAHGINPYEPNELLRVQESVGWPHGAPLPTWYGPWILATLRHVFGPAGASSRGHWSAHACARALHPRHVPARQLWGRAFDARGGSLSTALGP